MADHLILKAVELSETSAAFRKKYPTVGDVYRAGWYLQPKYDGCFGMAIIREDGGSQMLSRTGHDYSAACYHILADLAEACESSYGMGWHSRVFLGEVWNPELDFPTISGKFRKLAPAPELQFVVNDVLPGTMPGPYIRKYSYRYADMKELLRRGYRSLRTVELISGNPVLEARAYVAAGGFDGAILRDPNAGYSLGKAKDGQIIKVKPTISLDLRVTALLPGEGKHAGRTGALRCSLGGDQFVDVGTGLSDADRGVDLLGKIVEVEAMGWSTEGKLREPRFKGVRFDKDTPDR